MSLDKVMRSARFDGCFTIPSGLKESPGFCAMKDCLMAVTIPPLAVVSICFSFELRAAVAIWNLTEMSLSSDMQFVTTRYPFSS